MISAFSKGQGVTKRGQGAAPCKRSLGRTMVIRTVPSLCGVDTALRYYVIRDVIVLQILCFHW